MVVGGRGHNENEPRKTLINTWLVIKVPGRFNSIDIAGGKR